MAGTEVVGCLAVCVLLLLLLLLEKDGIFSFWCAAGQERARAV